MKSSLGSPVIEVRELVKCYHGSTEAAVDGLSFEVDEGQFVALLGPNGAGKTTTISILTTGLNKTSGSVRIAGYDLDTQAREIRARIGIIFQHPSLDLRLTAEENLRLHASLYGLYGYRPLYRAMPREYRQQVARLARMLGIEGELFQPLRSYSGGMRRKLEIVRSLMHHPKVLFLDEPTQGLDPVSRQSLWRYLREVQRAEGVTLLLTTHYLEEAEGADRVFVVSKGRLRFSGTPGEMKQAVAGNYLVLDAADRTQLRHDLAGSATEVLSDGTLKVLFDGPTPQPVLRRVSVPLTVMRWRAPSLEDAYIEMIGPESDVAEGA